MQKDDLNKKGLPKDTVVRTYSIEQPEYRIQPEDILYVDFESLTPKDFDFLNREQSNQNRGSNVAGGNALVFGELVDVKGEIPFPFIGKIKVSGLTVYEIQEMMQKIMSEYLDSPIIKVRLINFRFTVLGEVNSEGTVILANNRVTMLEALGWAGGLTDLADKANVKIIRQHNGETTVQYINLLQEDFINSPYYYINQNDVLIVSALKQRPYHKYFGQNLALFISSFSLLLLVINLAQ